MTLLLHILFGEQDGVGSLPAPLQHGPVFSPDVSRHRPACSIADRDGGGGLAVNPTQTSCSGARRLKTSAFNQSWMLTPTPSV